MDDAARREKTRDTGDVIPDTGTHPSRRFITAPAAVFGLMFAINAVNYFDRFLAVAAGPTLKLEFHLTDRDIGILSSVFLLIYTITAIPFGLLADQFSRARVVSMALGLWSIASTATGFARGFGTLFVTRAAVGVGEAGYYPAGTALLSAHFPLETRARVMSRWGAGQVIGLTLAFAVNALLAHLLGATHGWRVAFLLSGIPGVMLAVLMWFTADTPREAPQPVRHLAKPDASTTSSDSPLGTSWVRIRSILRIRTIWLVIVLQGLYFAVATPAITFLPIYIRSPHGPFRLDIIRTDLIAGMVIIVGGLSGMLLGGPFSDWFSRRMSGGRVFSTGVGYLLALPCYVTMLLSHHLVIFCVSGTLAVLALNLQVGPLTAAVQDATPSRMRATAVALTLLLSHLLGDIWTPGVVGGISTALREHTGVALLIVGLPALLIAGTTGLLSARVYAADVAEREATASLSG